MSQSLPTVLGFLPPTCLLQDASSQDVPGKAPGTVGPAGSRAKSKATLDELLDTLKLLEEDPEPLPRPWAYLKDKYAWTDEVTVGTLPQPTPHSEVIPCGGQGSPLGSFLLQSEP